MKYVGKYTHCYGIEVVIHRNFVKCQVYIWVSRLKSLIVIYNYLKKITSNGHGYFSRFWQSRFVTVLRRT